LHSPFFFRGGKGKRRGGKGERKKVGNNMFGGGRTARFFFIFCFTCLALVSSLLSFSLFPICFGEGEAHLIPMLGRVGASADHRPFLFFYFLSSRRGLKGNESSEKKKKAFGSWSGSGHLNERVEESVCLTSKH
jgi:hypothetical protein